MDRSIGNNGFIISKETWDHMPDEQKQWIMFETMQAVCGRLKGLERWNKCLSALGGVAGGIIAFFSMKLAM